MKNLKEWFSDNLRYFFLLAAVFIGILAIVLGMRMYNTYRSENALQSASAETDIPEEEVIKVFTPEAAQDAESEESQETAADKAADAQESETKAQTETEKSAQSETKAQTEQKNTSQSETKTQTEQKNTSQSETKAQTEQKNTSHSETKAQTERKNTSQSESKAQTEKKNTSQSETKAQTESKPKTDTDKSNAASGQTEGKAGRTETAIAGGTILTSEGNSSDQNQNLNRTQTNSQTETVKQSETVKQTETQKQTEEIDTLKKMSAATKYSPNEANIRSGPGTEYDILGDTDIGEAITVTGQTTSWYQVSINGQTGYISKSLLEDTYTPVYLTMTGTCYIRSEADYGDNIIGEYGAGTTVEFLGDVGGWYKVRVDGMTGYMGARFFQ